jgi:hypothetical protein
VVLFVFLLDFRIVPTVWYYLFFILSDAIKEYNEKKNYISEQLQKANQQIIETGKIDTTNTTNQYSRFAQAPQKKWRG